MTMPGSTSTTNRRSHSRWGSVLGLMLAATGLGSSATAQPSGSADQSERQLRQNAADFVRGTGVAQGATPAARWVHPVCPRVLGVSPEGAQAAENMVRRIALQVGATVADAPCDSNVLITFAPNPTGIVEAIRNRSPDQFSGLSPADRDYLMSDSVPIRWWYTTRVIGRHGDGGIRGAGSAGQNTPGTHTGSGAGSDFGGDMPTLMHYESSVVSTLSQRVLNSASVVIDEDAVMGMRLDSVVAYAALVALAEIRSPDFAPSGSILSLFGSTSAPRRLTDQDLAFLRALYRLPLDREASQHRGMLVGAMVDQQTGG